MSVTGRKLWNSCALYWDHCTNCAAVFEMQFTTMQCRVDFILIHLFYDRCYPATLYLEYRKYKWDRLWGVSERQEIAFSFWLNSTVFDPTLASSLGNPDLVLYRATFVSLSYWNPESFGTIKCFPYFMFVLSFLSVFSYKCWKICEELIPLKEI